MDDELHNTMPKNALPDITLFLLTGCIVFAVLVHTSPLLPATWDEGEFNSRVVSVQSGTPRQYWRGTLTEEGHPQLPVILSAIGRKVAAAFSSQSVPDNLHSLRYGTIAFFAFAAAAVFYRLKKDFDFTAALFGIASLLLIPRLFAHCQIAAWDSTLTASWLLTWAVCAPLASSVSVPRCLLAGCAAGLTLASKFSGLGVLLPLFFYLFFPLFRGASLRQCSFRCAIAVLSAWSVFVVFNPPLWNQPLFGTLTWFSLNTHRTINVAVLFFGRMYDLYHPLPWYNTLVWTAITVPVGLLLCVVCGLATLTKNKDKRFAGLFLVLNLLPLLVIRALPGTPVHDGERLFLPAFAFVGIIAGIGAAAVWNRQSRQFYCRCMVILIYAVAAVNLCRYAPQWLSYYNGFIGGLSGAVRCGMEPAYWWDGFDREVIDWLYAHTHDGESIAFSAGSERSLELSVIALKFGNGTQDIRRNLFVIPSAVPLEELQTQGFRYYVLQCRPSATFPRDDELLQQKTPVFVKYAAGVPVLKVFDVSGKR